MGLRLKFNIVLAVVFGAGMAVSAWVSHELLQRNAKEEVLRNAGLMMEAALAVRGYIDWRRSWRTTPALASPALASPA